MQGTLDTTFGTFQRDLFESGLVAQIGANSFAVWTAIKSHADFQTGKAWPSIRRLCELTGLTDKTVSRCLETLQTAHLLRIEKKGNRRVSTRYVARERMDVRLGDRLLCLVVIDYIPARIRQTLHRLGQTIKTGETNPDAWLDVEIVPADGFVWNATRGVLEAKIPVPILSPVQEVEKLPESLAGTLLGLKLAGAKAKALAKKKPPKE
jgi:hypothetical protein